MGRLLRIALVACGVLATGATLAWASNLTSFGFVGSDGTITACVGNANGNVRFTDPSTASCRNNESTVVLNQRGPQGPPGPSAAFDQGGAKGSGGPVPLAANVDANSTTPVGRLDLPAGAFAITAKAEFHNTGSTDVLIACFFNPVDNGKLIIGPNEIATETFVGTYQSDVPSEVDLQCSTLGDSTADLNHFRAVAIQVGSITQQ